MKLKKLVLMFLSLWFFTQAQVAQTIGLLVPLIITLCINGTAPGGTYYNGSLGPSNFTATASLSDLTQGSSQPSQNYLINGAIYTNCGLNLSDTNCGGLTQATVTVNPTRVILQNGTSQVAVDLRGQIGGANVSSSAQVITFTKTNTIANQPWKANIQIIGDVDESTLGPNDKQGTYTGSFQISTIII